MRPVLGCAFALAIAAVPLVLAHADATSDQIKAAYDNQCKLLMAGDFDGFAKTMTDDFVNVDPNGKKENRDQTVADSKLVMQQAKISTCEAAVSNVAPGPAGSKVVSAILTQTGSIASPQGTAPIEAASTETDTWVQKNGAWLMKASDVTAATIKENGKVVQQMGGSPAPSPSVSPTPTPY